MSQIITFYSFKGGVGRTLALANVACAIASKGRTVLIVDWDLEAPGLHRYFKDSGKRTPVNDGGTIGLLEGMASNNPADSSEFETTLTIPKTEFFPGCQIEMLAAGMDSEDYERRVLDFDWEDFYREKRGASQLESLRETWRERFDFVLIDSRTGITDAGGICTIFLPDTLALVFTPNEQSLVGAIDVARRAQKGRQTLSFDRRGLTIFPIPSRLDSRTEEKESALWMTRFSDEMSPFLSAWCPTEVSARSLFERIKIPHVAFFSFGEKLPMVTHRPTDPDLPGFYYGNIASVLEGQFAQSAILSAVGLTKEFKSDISRIIKYAPEGLIGREDELKLLNDAWGKVRRGESTSPHVLTFVALGGEGKTSLVAKWAAGLAADDWPGCDAVFAWSFYSQGTRDQLAASSDLFLKEALNFFGDDGDKEFAASAAGAFEKGQRLARIVGQRRSLLILDGLEPLQYPTEAKAFKPGELKDQGIAKLLKDLASTSVGLCIVTTRIEMPDLNAFKGGAVIETHLKRLPRAAGVSLLKSLGVKGSERRDKPLKDSDPNGEKVNEFEKLVEDVKGHALTLTLLGGFLKRAFQGDIRKRDRVKFEKADEKMDGGHAFRTMAAYEQWLLRDGGDEARREVAVLRLMGLFDRPADAGCLAALRSETIPGLTEPLAGLADDDWEYCLSGLETAKLLTVNRDASGAPLSLDSHPHLREYFGRQLRIERPDAWRAAHRRLYEHLCATTREGDQPTLEDLQPLYQAVVHGCQAGLQQETYDKVYFRRILRGNENYSVRKLGAFFRDLGAVACFFDSPWNRVSPRIGERTQAWILHRAAFYLRALGRLAEALEPMRAGVELGVRLEDWNNAARYASNLSELELTLGEVAGAVGDAEQSVTYADRGGDAFQRMATRTTHADALHQAGRRTEAETRFREAEEMHAESQSAHPLLYSLAGFLYCDLLLATPERTAWQMIVRGTGVPPVNSFREHGQDARATCRAVSKRAAQTLKIAERNNWLLDIALDHLTLGRAALSEVVLAVGGLPFKTQNSELKTSIDAAVGGLRRAGTTHHIPRALLIRAWLRFLSGVCTGPESAQEDLDEAWEIAERGPMKLFMADIHLYRARLFFREKTYPWKSSQEDLAAAEKLINDCGYHRRDEELADAKLAILGG